MQGDPKRRSAVGAEVDELIPDLKGWVTLPSAAAQLRISRAAIYYLVFEAQVFSFREDLRKLNAGTKPIFLISRDAVQREKVRRGLIDQPA